MNKKQVEEFIKQIQDPTNISVMVENSLKLYVWYHVLNDYTSGLAFAMAYSVEEARTVILKSYKNNNDWNSNPKQTLYEIYEQEPMIFEHPFGDYIIGGA